MADSFVDFGLGGVDLTSSQTAGAFSGLTFDYINSTDVYVTRTTAAGVSTELTSSQFTVTGTGTNFTVTITDSAILPLATSDVVRIGRTTPISALTRSFTDGSVLKADDLNTQNKQLLFATQENVDKGVGSLPVDTDDKYDAGGKIIKNLGAGSSDDDSVTKGYVDGLQLYGAGVSVPQSWTFTTSADDIESPHRDFVLTSPVPNSANDVLFLIEVGGVIQTPDTYTITESSGVYTLRLLNAESGVANSTSVSVRNFGISRHILEQPLKTESASDPTFTIQRIGSQSANLQEWVDEASTPNVLASVNIDGDASFVDVSASANAAVTGNATVGGTLGVTGETTLSGGVAGNLNILTGALQFAGANAKQILQIVIADENSDAFSLTTTGTQTWTQMGHDGNYYHIATPLNITPLNTDSTIVVFGFMKTSTNASRAAGGGTVRANHGRYLACYEGETQTTHEASINGDGTLVWEKAFTASQFLDSNTSDSIVVTNSTDNSLGFVVEPSSHTTDQLKYSLAIKVLSTYSTNGVFPAKLYAETRYSAGFHWVAVEVL